MAQIVRYVDPDATGAGDGTSWTDAYTALQTCLSTEATDLDTAGDYMTINCRSSGGSDDTTAITSLTQANYNTSATSYIEIIGTDFPSTGVFDGAKYLLAYSGSANHFVVGANYCRLINLQMQSTVTGAENAKLIYVDGQTSGGSDIRIDSCVLKGVSVSSPTGSNMGVYFWDGDATVKVYNTVVYDFKSGTNFWFRGFYRWAGTVTIYNCTTYNTYYGYEGLTVKNSIAANGGFNGGSVDYCCSDAGTGTNAQTPSGGSWTNEMSDPANGDFRLLSGGNCVGNGTDDPGSGLYSDDIIGTTRS